MKTNVLKAKTESAPNEIVWAFDLGKGSIGEAVRQGTKFLHKASLLIPADFAETKTAANRRRAWRTRQAHKAREQWLEQIWLAAGLEVLRGRQIRRDEKTGKWLDPIPGDKRLESEFGEDACYTSCLLRIKLLRGEKLEPWQIFKALRSAIQKRGYGKIPWAAKEARRAGKSIEELEKEEEGKDENYVAAKNRWRDFKATVPADFHFPCYYDAWKMGLWNPKEPNKLPLRVEHTHEAESTRSVRFDREDVESEIKTLAEKADRQLNAELESARKKLIETFRNNKLARIHAINERRRAKNKNLPRDKQKKLLEEPTFEHKAENVASFLIYGPTGLPYASYSVGARREFALRQGSADDWMGALGQKIPRFDNRILNDCILIPRFHVCKAEIRQDAKMGKPIADSLLPAEVTFLMKLKNTLVAGANGQRKLSVEEIRKIYEAVSADVQKVEADAKDWAKKIAARLSLTDTSWGRKKGIKELGLYPLPGHGEVKSPKHSGRSAFSRPALRLLKELILLGKSPQDFYQEKIAELGGNIDEKKGLVPRDLKFLSDMGDSWDNIHVPAQKLEALAARHTENGKLNVDKAVADLLADINDPVVRHRLNVFADRLRYLRDKYGEPQEVVLEFVRKDFLPDPKTGDSPKRRYMAFLNEREAARKKAREKAAEAGAVEKSAPLKYELAQAQGFICLYCGQPFAASKLDEYEIEHIVPRSQNGPDAMVNYVLAHHECNEAKDQQTPFQWWHNNQSQKAPAISWDGYKKLVDSCATSLRNKKVQLLLREDAPELVERYTALAETAWVSKLAQTIASLFFGWKNGNDQQGRKRITIISGGLTGRVRRKYRLNSILNPCPDGEDLFLWEEKCEKNRDDDRHHALDAMVISFLPNWMRDAKKEGFFRFPEGVHQEYFAKQVADVVPQFLCFEKAYLAETIYSKERDPGGQITQRVELRQLAYKPIALNKTKFDLDYATKQINSVCDNHLRSQLLDMLATCSSGGEWDARCKDFRIVSKDGRQGAKVIAVKVRVGKADEYADLSKGRLPSWRGAWRKAKQGHKGQIVYTDSDGKPRIRPIYTFESIPDVKKEIAAAGGQIYGFFRSGCLARIETAIAHKTTPVEAGIVRINTIRKDGWVVVTGSSGKASSPINIGKFIEARLKPLHALETIEQAALRKVKLQDELKKQAR